MVMSSPKPARLSSISFVNMGTAGFNRLQTKRVTTIMFIGCNYAESSGMPAPIIRINVARGSVRRRTLRYHALIPRSRFISAIWTAHCRAGFTSSEMSSLPPTSSSVSSANSPQRGSALPVIRISMPGLRDFRQDLPISLPWREGEPTASPLRFKEGRNSIFATFRTWQVFRAMPASE